MSSTTNHGQPTTAKRRSWGSTDRVRASCPRTSDRTSEPRRWRRILAVLKEFYGRTFRFNMHNRAKWVAEQAAQIPAGSRVLDVGAGRGQYRPLFAHCDYRTQDFAQELGTIGNYTPLDYVSDIVDIPVESGSFDVALCAEVLEHVPEPILAVREIVRTLRPGGKLLISAPLGCLLHQEPYHFYGGYTPHWYRKFLTEAGCDVEQIEPNRGFFSLFAQEGIRFSCYIDPRRTTKYPLLCPLLSGLWLVTFPFFRVLFPLLAKPLDRLGVEKIATVGYHVVARKRAVSAQTISSELKQLPATV